MATPGCGWLRTLKNGGTCRADPVARCLASGECSCPASDFHGNEEHDSDIELFLPLSIIATRNLAPRTYSKYTVSLSVDIIPDEPLVNFASRTDFTKQSLTVHGNSNSDMTGLTGAPGLSFLLKFMPTWDTPGAMSGLLFDGFGLRGTLSNDMLTVVAQGKEYNIGLALDYQCNQLAVVVSASEVKVFMGGVKKTTINVGMHTLQAAMAGSANPRKVLTIGKVCVFLKETIPI